MKKIIVGWMAACLLVAASALPASAGIYADDATRCLGKSMSEADQIILVRWIFAGMTLHPSLKEFSQISQAQRTELDDQMRTVVMRMLMESCRKETVDAIKYEGTGFLEKSFEAVGGIAVGGLMNNAEVNKGLSAWVTPEVIKNFGTLAAEAGRVPASKP